jgi:hypothetical protein
MQWCMAVIGFGHAMVHGGDRFWTEFLALEDAIGSAALQCMVEGSIRAIQ